MKNETGHFCPACGEDHCVLDPDENDNGHSGDWFCFACRSHGTYSMDFQQTGDAPSDPVNPDPETPAPGPDVPEGPGSEV